MSRTVLRTLENRRGGGCVQRPQRRSRGEQQAGVERIAGLERRFVDRGHQGEPAQQRASQS